jgi:hypothetical protein
VPSIRSIRVEGTNAVVTVQVPAGLRSITLECRDRLGPGGWEPRAVTRVDGTGGEVQLRIGLSRPAELMRVRATAADPLPSSFYTGTNSFFEASSSGVAGPGAVDMRGNFGDPPTEDPSREVVESDIWKIRGQTLYFFNQLRGLQVLDISNPDAPSLRGTLELPAVGEDLYVLDDHFAVLLARQGCDYNASEVLVVAVGDTTPNVAVRLPVSGSILESRLVGTALYVASQSYRPVDGSTNTVWEWVTLVSSFDLSDPAHAVARNSLAYPGYGNVVTATDRLLFVVTQDPANWWQSIVRSIDITSPDGTMRSYESIRTAGRVPDKFKLHWDGGVLTTISEDWRTVPGRRLTTRLETFRLPDPRSLGPAGVIKLGELELGRGEQLHATRFDGHLVYVVTFFRIDPLWVVDVEDPVTPRIVGSVDVPGWSTFIQPLGDRLVTIGVETNRVAVSLFNVADPSAPSLLSRVRLGQNYSWSEANWDEKAFSVLPDAGLILVPFSGDTLTNGYASSVQLVDLNPDTVVARGLIQQRFQPRRATLYQNRILSISEWQLLSVDASDRDHPMVTATVSLAFPVDRVFLHGEFLVELGATDGWAWWAGSVNPAVRAAAAASPDRVLASLSLPQLPVLGAAQRGDSLYILQAEQSYWSYPVPLAGADPAVTDVPGNKVVLSVVDLSDLPALRVSGQIETNAPLTSFGGDFQAVWPKSGTLVFAGGGFNYIYRCFECPMLLADSLVARPIPWWGWGGAGGELLAFDVADAASPSLASFLDLSSNAWWNYSQAFSVDGLVYLSHQTSEFIPLDNAIAPIVVDGGAADPAGGGPIVYPPGNWVSRSYLDVVDYTEAKEPLVRQPVNIPGRLTGISRQGAVLYTVGTHWTTNTSTAWIEYLDASAYDGVSVHLIDSLPLPESWPHPTLVLPDGTSLLVRGDYAVAPGEVPPWVLESWQLSDAGKFTRVGSARLPGPVSLLANYGALLAAQQTDNGLVLVDLTDPSALTQVGAGRPAGCTWYDLSRADGALARGLWIPLGAYGVGQVPVLSVTP